ncbi:MAG: hypothetical protein V2A76_04690 [Planctomycetota bacterium]
MPIDKNKALLFFLPFWIACGVGTVYIARELYSRLMPAQAAQNLTVYPNKPLSVPHPVYGRFPSPGEFDLTITVPQTPIPYHFKVRTDEEGYRTTSTDPAALENLPEIWVFGCSFTWGMPLDNEKTFPWLLQQRLPGWNVKNYAVYAFGNVHALMQMREFLDDRGRKPPAVAVFAYCSFHRKRNVAAPSWLRPETLTPKFRPDMRYPRASIENDRVRIDLVSFLVPDEAEDPPIEEQNLVTLAIFRELAEECRKHGIKPVLGVQFVNGESDPVPDYCRDELGFTVVDMQVDIKDPRYNVLPYNRHPSAEAHRLYADKLTPVLQRLLGP